MIGVDFTGRLGNQLFTYAFARYVMEQRAAGDEPLLANFKRCGSSAEQGWGDSLRYFNLKPYQTADYDLILKHGSIKQRVAYLAYVLLGKVPAVGRNDSLMARVEKLLRPAGLHFTGAADGAYHSEYRRKSLFIRGYFQDRRFFDAIRPILLREITPKADPLPQNRELYLAAQQAGSVCVSVRRGDYLSQQYKKDFYVCTPEYYQKAIALLRQRVASPTFIFFSDDIEWVRANMRVDGCRCYYERGDDPSWETLRLMYSCNHFIISNSTFAWWAQYLGRRADKIVVSPSRWFANPLWHSNLVCGDFLSIDDSSDIPRHA